MVADEYSMLKSIEVTNKICLTTMTLRADASNLLMSVKLLHAFTRRFVSKVGAKGIPSVSVICF